MNDAIIEKIAPETWRMLIKAANYDRDIEQATHEAEVRGRNAKISDIKTKKTLPENMPPILSGGGAAMPQDKTLTALERINAANGPDIFDRGNPRRTKRNHQ